MRALAPMALNPALAAFRKTHPAVKVQLFDMTQGEQITALRHGSIDVGLVGQEAAVLTREFYWRRIARLPLVVALPENHRLTEERQIRMSELKDEMFIGAAEEAVPGRNRWVAKICRRAKFRPRFVRYGESLANTLSLVVSEHSVAIVPDYLRQIPTPEWRFGRLLTPVRPGTSSSSGSADALPCRCVRSSERLGSPLIIHRTNSARERRVEIGQIIERARGSTLCHEEWARSFSSSGLSQFTIQLSAYWP